jgi:arylsulfatase A-like enzyme
VLVSTLVVEGGIAFRESRAEAGLPPAREGAPNVLFIILDTVRARTLSLYGYDRETTPNIDRLGDRGVVFDFGISPGTWTVPSHGSMFTGLWPHELGTWWTDPEREPPAETLAQFMSGKGYRTAGFIGNWYHIGAESGMGTGFVHYDDLGRSPAQIVRGSAMIRWLSQRRSVRRVIGLYETLGRRRGHDVSRSFLSWLEDDGERPWFAFLNYFDAHSPFLPPQPFDAKFGTSVSYREPVVIEELNRAVEPTPAVAQAEMDAYDGGMAWLDDEIGRLFARLEESGALSNTIVIIGSDHGEELGEHGRWGHAYSLYAEIVHVPLLMFGPGVPAASRVARPVSLRNIPATIADLAGLTDPPFPGTTLAAMWSTDSLEDEPADAALSEFGRYRSLHEDGYHYLVGVFDDLEHLYDYRVDPLDLHDLAGDADALAVLASFRERIDSIAAPVGRPADAGVPPPGN